MKRRRRLRVGDVVVILDNPWTRRLGFVGYSAVVVWRANVFDAGYWVVDNGILNHGLYRHELEYTGVDVREAK